jgi:hypothetical protein
MFTRLIRFAPFAAALAVAAVSVPAQAGVSWSVGINAPIAPGVQVGTVINGGHPHYYRPAPVIYAPAPVYMPPPVVYAPPPPVYVAPVVYAPRPVYVAPRPYYYRPPVVYRPYPPVQNWHPVRPGHGGNPGHGGYGPMASAR